VRAQQQRLRVEKLVPVALPQIGQPPLESGHIGQNFPHRHFSAHAARLELRRFQQRFQRLRITAGGGNGLHRDHSPDQIEQETVGRHGAHVTNEAGDILVIGAVYRQLEKEKSVPVRPIHRFQFLQQFRRERRARLGAPFRLRIGREQNMKTDQHLEDR